MTRSILDTQTASAAALKALLETPTAVVAAAYRAHAGEVAGIALTAALYERLGDELEDATGQRAFALEHMRDRRPLGETLDVARLVSAQRRMLAAV